MSTRTPVYYSVAVKSVPHLFGIGYVAIVCMYMHYKVEDDEDEENIKGLGYRLMEKRVLWTNGSNTTNWEAVKFYVDKFLIKLFPEDAKPVEYHERRKLGYALYAYQKAKVEEIFETVYKELRIDAPNWVRWLDDIDLVRKPCKPARISFKGDHGDSHYLAQSIKDAGNIYLNVLRRRYNDKEYYWLTTSYAHVQKPEFTQEEVSALPESMRSQKQQMQNMLNQYNSDIKAKTQFEELFKKIKLAIDTNDAVLAYSCLKEIMNLGNDNFEVEEFTEFEEIENIKIKL